MVARWEILNEPDLRSGPHVIPTEPSPTWQGTWEQYLELYALTSQQLKSTIPTGLSAARPR